MPDADLDKGLPSIMTSFYGCAGERCLSGSVLVAVGDVYDELKERFVAASRALKVGNGLVEGVQMGPLVSKKHKEKVLGYIEKGIAEGAKLVLDGRNIQVEGCPDGFYVGPTVFDDVAPSMTIAREEIFGPVVSIVRVKDLDEGLALIDNSEYGNAACLYTTNGCTAREFKYRASAGMLGINVGIARPHGVLPLRRDEGIVLRRYQGSWPGSFPVFHEHQGRYPAVVTA